MNSPKSSKSVRRDVFLSLAPAILLNLVAVTHLFLVRTVHLTPWKGGGFGMFSTMDDGAVRPIGIRVTGPNGHRTIPFPPSLGTHAYQATLLPSKSRLRALGYEIAALERAKGNDVSRVHIAVWRLEYDPLDLTPRPEVVQEQIITLEAQQ